MKYITVKKLRELNAYSSAIIEFINEFGKNGKIHVKKLIEILHKNKDSNGYSFWLFKTFKLTGICYDYHNNGQISYKINFKNGLRHGERIVYHSNGKIVRKTNYKNGKLHGEYISYYENGKISYKINFKNGLKHGEYISYYENNKIFYKVNYKNGLRHGEGIRYYSTGKIWYKDKF